MGKKPILMLTGLCVCAALVGCQEFTGERRRNRIARNKRNPQQQQPYNYPGRNPAIGMPAPGHPAPGHPAPGHPTHRGSGQPTSGQQVSQRNAYQNSQFQPGGFVNRFQPDGFQGARVGATNPYQSALNRGQVQQVQHIAKPGNPVRTGNYVTPQAPGNSVRTTQPGRQVIGQTNPLPPTMPTPPQNPLHGQIPLPNTMPMPVR